VDEHAEDAASARKVADGPVRRLVDAARDKALELLATLVEDPDGGVARAGQLEGGLEHAVQHHVEVELGQQAAPHLDEPGEAVLVEARAHGHRCGERTAVRAHDAP
jgi:hypothetical protein